MASVEAASIVDVAVEDPFGGHPEHIFRYMYVAEIGVRGVLPRIGSSSGGTEVTVFGERFGRGSYVCRFGGKNLAPGEFVSTSSVVCISPSHPSGEYSLELSGDGGVSFVDSGEGFEFVEQALVKSVLPSKGTTVGGTMVTVTGGPFVSTEDSMCMFGAVAAEMIVVNTTHVVCEVPPREEAGECVVNVRVDGRVLGGEKLAFLYVESARVDGIVPSKGRPDGGTVVEVTGSGFDVGGMMCRFGADHVGEGEVVSSTLVRCMSAASHAGNEVSVEVSAAWGEYTRGSHRFLYEDSVIVSRVEPTRVMPSSGALMSIIGSHFTTQGGLVARLGGKHVEPLHFVSSSVVLCGTGRLMLMSGNVSVEVSSNGVDFVASGQSVVVEYGVRLREVVPSRVPAGGGAHVTVVGWGFEGSSEMLMFGEHGVKCDVESSGHVVCALQTVASAAVGEVEVKVAGESFSVPFVFDVGATVEGMSPSRGPVHGGTVVSVHGTSFMAASSLECLFGDSTPSAATVHSSTLILCETPPSSRDGISHLTVTAGSVAVTRTGDVDFGFLYELPFSITGITP
eukprot:CAMPEP_0174925698 /NCGR_PEP_ID=MMETSP1355-20121228/8087_1 /TAXON_ID=464990 /ORGANISM="Hemiselmis tepida, Strain CCMP443" /LENGTH=565 /DNA_ID=CAMNT_0016171647 /DNA_START=185 /DNA_END=1878 /DNA_ORIENTATION=-